MRACSRLALYSLLAALAGLDVPVNGRTLTPNRSDPVLVRRVLDGDTIDVSAVGRVRLLGIDAPEMGGSYDRAAPYAREAQQKLAGLIANRWIRLEYDVDRSDAYQRQLAYVLLETGLFVNAEIVREGLARVSARKPLSRLQELQRAEDEARRWHRGIWSRGP